MPPSEWFQSTTTNNAPVDSGFAKPRCGARQFSSSIVMIDLRGTSARNP
jgi:hypothetical protein